MAIVESYLGMDGNHSGKTFDALLSLYSGTLAAGASTPNVYLGRGFVDADLVFNVTGTVPADTSVEIELADDAAFTVGVVVQQAFEPKTGRNIKPFRNNIGQGDLKAYIRLTLTGGPVIVEAFLAKK